MKLNPQLRSLTLYGDNIGGRNTVNINNNIRKKLLRYFQNVI